MATVIALDPGYEQTAYVVWDGNEVRQHGIAANWQLAAMLDTWQEQPGEKVLVVEEIVSYGQRIGKETIKTIFWTGQIHERWSAHRPGNYICHQPYRVVKQHLCDSAHAKDADVRRALLDRFGPGRNLAVGTVKAPGPLHGIVKDEWQALAHAVTYLDQNSGWHE